MPSLSEAYSQRRDDRFNGRDPRRVYLGAVTSLLGACALVAAMLVVATPLSSVVGVSGEVPTQRLAGLLGGVGVPAILLGVVAVLPSKRRQQVGVVLGALVALAGVGLFAHAYPGHWTNSSDPLVFETAIVYFSGGLTSLWFVFVAIANFRRHNAPRGTVTLELETEGETHRVEVTPRELREYRSMMGDGGTEEELVAEIESRRGR